MSSLLRREQPKWESFGAVTVVDCWVARPTLLRIVACFLDTIGPQQLFTKLRRGVELRRNKWVTQFQELAIWTTVIIVISTFQISRPPPLTTCHSDGSILLMWNDSYISNKGVLEWVGFAEICVDIPESIKRSYSSNESVIHNHGKFTIESNFKHFTKSPITSVLDYKILSTPHSRNFCDFTWNHEKMGKFFTQNHEKLRKLPFTVFTFHANGETWIKSCSCLIHVNFDQDPALMYNHLPT